MNLVTRYPHARLLTAWPASDELTRPFLGYVAQPLTVVRIENFSPLEIGRAAQATDQFDVVFLFTTKWEPPHPLLQRLAFGKGLQERFFDYHEDLSPSRAADILGGRVVRYLNRNNEWIAIIAIEKVEDAAAHGPFTTAASLRESETASQARRTRSEIFAIVRNCDFCLLPIRIALASH